VALLSNVLLITINERANFVYISIETPTLAPEALPRDHDDLDDSGRLKIL